MQDHSILTESGSPFGVHPKPCDVLVVDNASTFGLNPEQIDDIEIGQCGIKVVGLSHHRLAGEPLIGSHQDEVDLDRHYISWVSPLARALIKAGPGDTVVLRAPGGTEELEILEVRYERIPMAPFTEPPGAEAVPVGVGLW